ncbi:MAG: response regulator [Ferruginibacter sp.]
MKSSPLTLLLADDDKDDCIFFKEALDEIPVATELVTVNDGVQLMELLVREGANLPFVLYLDLNMPLKNGFDALHEIKSNEKLKDLPVIMFSTSFTQKVADQLQQQGAKYYMQKPAEFENLKKIIHRSLILTMENQNKEINEEDFLIVP